MKKSTILQILLLSYFAEALVALSKLNVEYNFLSFQIPEKYELLCLIFLAIYQGFHFFYILNRGTLTPNSTKTHFYETYGTGKYNILYTYPHLLFALMSFQASYYPLAISASCMFIITNMIRSTQNGYADTYELERLKEQAKTKPVVTLD